jgi:hypothetical protein
MAEWVNKPSLAFPILPVTGAGVRGGASDPGGLEYSVESWTRNITW